MEKSRGILFLLVITSNVFLAQVVAPRYWVQFTDKNATNYSVNNPLAYLSQRAIDRRTKQGISITEQDLPVCQAYLDSVRLAGNVNLHFPSKWLNGVLISTKDTNAIIAIENFSFVSGFNQVKLKKTLTPDKFEHEFENKISLPVEVIPNYPYGYTFNEFNLHNGQVLHDLSFKGQGMHIAVIDAGFYKANEREAMQHLFTENRILSTYDFVDQETSVYEDNYHGCAVFSIMAGKIDGVFMGSAPLASYHLLRTEDAFSEYEIEEYNWVFGAEYADSAGVDVINTSLGYTEFDNPSQNHTYTDMDGNTTIAAIGADIAASKGMLLFASAGNQGGSLWQVIGTPADADSTLAVAAVDSTGTRAWFSSTGPSFDGDVKPNIASVGWNKYYINPFDGRISQGNGTSFSSPFIAGFATCLWQAMPEKSNIEIKKIIEASSNKYNNPDSLTGYGIPNFKIALEQNSGFNYTEFENNEIENMYPNPVIDQLNIVFQSKFDQQIKLIFIAAGGATVVQETAIVLKGRNFIQVSDLGRLSAGVYSLRIEDATGDLIQKKVVIGQNLNE